MHYLRVGGSIFLCAVVLTLTGHAENKFIGVKKCAACHKAASFGGTAYLVWEKSGHAKAYETLLGDEAKKIAQEKGLKTAPAESPECLKCHVAGGANAKNVDKTYDMKEGVTCETCHGAASGWVMLHSKKGDENIAKAKEAGLTVGDKVKDVCVTCHNAESPTAKPFKFAEMWAKIKHEGPQKKK